MDGAFIKDEHYFQIRINEMYLALKRKWLDLIDPMVFVVSEFIYNNEEQTVPSVVGPEMVKNRIQKIPKQGMLFKDTRVAGLYPYRGGRLSLSVVLCQIQVGNVVRPLMQVIESASKALNFSMSLNPYVQIAGIVMQGFQALLGHEDTVPLVALRKEFDPDAGDVFAPGFFALIDKPDVDPETFWVYNNHLLQGNSEAEAKPYRDADYVLYSVVKDPDNKRSDVDTLPFQGLWERVKEEAARPGNESYESARANMLSLYQTMVLSPDLIPAEALALADDYADKMKKFHERAVKLTKRGEKTVTVSSELDNIRSKSLSILNM
jgi:hypothetical protein